MDKKMPDKISKERKKEIITAMRSAHKLARDEKTIGLTPYYALEGLDPKHRNKVVLNAYYREWEKAPNTQENNNFFKWLQKTHPESEQEKSITYFSDSQRAHYLIKTAADGTFTRGNNSKPYDTTAYKGKTPGMAAYIMDSSGRLYVGEHQVNLIHHSTFNAGLKVISAGMVRIEQGKITQMDHKSGHYAPNVDHFKNLLTRIDQNAFAAQAKIEFTQEQESLSGKLGDFLINVKNNKYLNWLPDFLTNRLIQAGNSLKHNSLKSDYLDYHKYKSSNSPINSAQNSQKNELIMLRQMKKNELKDEDETHKPDNLTSKGI